VLLVFLVFCGVFFVLFDFVLCLMYPMLPVSLDWRFLISTLVFTNVYAIRLQHIGVNIRMIRLKNHCGAPDFFPNFSKICVAQFFVFVVVCCGPLSVQITTVMHWSLYGFFKSQKFVFEKIVDLYQTQDN
jgi:hypothetical protein